MRAAGAATQSPPARLRARAWPAERLFIGTIVDVTFSTPQVEDGYLYDG